MDKFDNKYGFDSTQKNIIDFHKQRRMFAVKDDELFLAPENVDYTHAKWFENMGWMDSNDDKLMDKIVRGYIDETGVYSYVGYDFETNDFLEDTIRKSISKLSNELNLDKSLPVYAGLVKQTEGGKWPPKKKLGTIFELINNN